MKIAICDDEQNIREQIKALLENIMLQEKMVKKNEMHLFSNGKDLLASDVLSFDMIFLDIEMDVLGGLDTAKKIRERQKDSSGDIWGSFPLLIFVTGYREHMPEAFAVHAFGYVVKPIDAQAFEKLFLEASSACGKRDSEKKHIIIKNGEKLQKILLNDIVYIESSGRKNVIHTLREEVSYYGALSALEEELPPYFFRIHKGYIVNMKMIRQYNRSQMKLSDGSEILISKYRYGDFVAAYMEYLR